MSVRETQRGITGGHRVAVVEEKDTWLEIAWSQDTADERRAPGGDRRLPIESDLSL
jgi:hypothetical protein